MPLPTAAEITDPNATNAQMKQRLGQLAENVQDKNGIGSALSSIINPVFKSMSKNIFDSKYVVLDKIVDTTNGSLVNDIGGLSSGFILVKNLAEITVTLSHLTGYARAVCFYKEDFSFKSASNIPAGASTRTFTVPADVVYVRLTLKRRQDSFIIDLNNVQVEAGPLATQISPFVRGGLYSLDGGLVGSSLLNSEVMPVFESKTKNLFDPSSVIVGKNISSAGDVVDRAGAVITDYVFLPDSVIDKLSVSGLTASTYIKYGRFLDVNRNRVGNVSLAKELSQGTFNIPSGARYFQLTLKDTLDTFPLYLDQIQIEISENPTALVPYETGELKLFYNTPIPNSKDFVTKARFKEDINDALSPKFENGSKNIFNPEHVLLNKNITGDGVLVDSAGAISTMPIHIYAEGSIAVSGFSGSGAGHKAIRFLAEDKETVVAVNSIGPTLTEKIFTIPASAHYAQMTLKLSPEPAINPSLFQFEFGSSVTAFEPYVKGNLVELFNSRIGSRAGSTSKAIGASYLLFGDSITETSDVDNGFFDSTAKRLNWPTYAKSDLQMSVFRNYAKSGASFKNRSLEFYQFLGNQISTAIDNDENPDVIVVACGTNDGLTDLGTYEAAMTKATLADLDQTICLEAARHAFWTIRMKWPDAVCFYANPLQRRSSTPESLEPLYSGLDKMAKRYGFIVIDQNKESGIILELEVQGGAGKYLYDGLHPNAAGSRRQADLIVSKIVDYMSY